MRAGGIPCAPCLVAAAWAASCGGCGDDGGGRCDAGRLERCTLDDGGAGTRTCAPDVGWSACVAIDDPDAGTSPEPEWEPEPPPPRRRQPASS